MGDVKKRTLLASLTFVLSISMLLSFLYWFLKNEGFSEKNFLIGSSFVLFLAMSWAYIIVTHLLAPKVEQDAKLSQLSKEILHELNIPLSTINANSNMLKKNLKDEKSLKRLDRIDSASIRLERLYKELVYSIKKEISPIEKENFSLQNLLEERIEIFQAFNRNCFYLEPINDMINCDKIGFEKMIDNLFLNAMKYSDKNSPIKVYEKNNVLHIVDEGIGMDETELLRVYERYYQGSKNSEGEGIGLALVKEYCDSNDIEIDISSKKGSGTTISLNYSSIRVS